jgi:hypothetical protein
MRRYTGHMNGERYLGNKKHKEVHVLDNEKANCQINEIIAAKDDVPFDSLSVAHSEGYDNCAYCFGGSSR